MQTTSLSLENLWAGMQHKRVVGRERVSVIMRSRMSPALLTVRGFTPRNSHITLEVTLVLVSQLSSLLKIFEQKIDCSQSIKEIKINDVWRLLWILGAFRRTILSI